MDSSTDSSELVTQDAESTEESVELPRCPRCWRLPRLGTVGISPAVFACAARHTWAVAMGQPIDNDNNAEWER